MSKMEKENVFDFIRNSLSLSVWEIGCMRAVSLSLVAQQSRLSIIMSKMEKENVFDFIRNSVSISAQIILFLHTKQAKIMFSI